MVRRTELAVASGAMGPGSQVRRQRDGEASVVAEVTRRAFGPDGEAVARLPSALAEHPLGRHGVSLVATVEDVGVVGHVQLSRGWVDDERHLVAGLVLSPLSVLPEHQGRGLARALVTAALRAADEAGEPFVVLEGAPGLYARWGFTPAADHGLTPPSRRIPAPACQIAPLTSWDPATTGALVYNDVFWTLDAVGLRGDTLERVRTALGVAPGATDAG